MICFFEFVLIHFRRNIRAAVRSNGKKVFLAAREFQRLCHTRGSNNSLHSTGNVLHDQQRRMELLELMRSKLCVQFCIHEMEFVTKTNRNNFFSAISSIFFVEVIFRPQKLTKNNHIPHVCKLSVSERISFFFHRDDRHSARFFFRVFFFVLCPQLR